MDLQIKQEVLWPDGYPVLFYQVKLMDFALFFTHNREVVHGIWTNKLLNTFFFFFKTVILL